ncbi:MAG: UDP-N-acetylmuramate--L-alanine ligase [Anaerolineae bacterium]|nr:UDP-N-acetylmuramate--L-alanine ligase [Anaerolineae bacterium]
MAKVHFIGIGGSGLSAIARLLLERGDIVTGSDRELTPFAADLQKAGATVYIGHHPRNIGGADWVVRSSAIPDDNEEVVAAQTANINVYKRSDFLGELMADKTGIAVAGTHGKTTTTAMIAWILIELNRNPSFIVGSIMSNLGVNARAGKGKAFIIEADEYDRMFLGLKPHIAIVTNIEYDHPDFYPTYEDMYAAFEEFVDLLPADGTLVVCADDSGANSLINHARKAEIAVVGYSLPGEKTINSPTWVQARGLRPNSLGGFSFEVASNLNSDLSSIKVDLQVPGEHNVRNALAALAIVGLLGLSPQQAAKALAKFIGTSRRFEVRGEVDGITVIDDYAHHPTEITATLSGARARYPKRQIWAVWQPHTYSRTKEFFLDFSRAFKDADKVIVSEVYAAREPKEEFSSAEIVSAMPHPSARFIATLEEISQHLIKLLQSEDVLLVLSAGDADQISTDVLAGLQER